MNTNKARPLISLYTETFKRVAVQEQDCQVTVLLTPVLYFVTQVPTLQI